MDTTGQVDQVIGELTDAISEWLVPLRAGEPLDPSLLPLYRSKAGGAMPFARSVEPGFILLSLREQPGNLNFGSLRLLVVRDSTGRLQLALV